MLWILRYAMYNTSIVRVIVVMVIRMLGSAQRMMQISSAF